MKSEEISIFSKNEQLYLLDKGKIPDGRNKYGNIRKRINGKLLSLNNKTITLAFSQFLEESTKKMILLKILDSLKIETVEDIYNDIEIALKKLNKIKSKAKNNKNKDDILPGLLYELSKNEKYEFLRKTQILDSKTKRETEKKINGLDLLIKYNGDMEYIRKNKCRREIIKNLINKREFDQNYFRNLKYGNKYFEEFFERALIVPKNIGMEKLNKKIEDLTKRKKRDFSNSGYLEIGVHPLKINNYDVSQKLILNPIIRMVSIDELA